jgi:outer membrane lipoprotein SlyB
LFQEGKENNAMDTNTKRLSPLLTVAATSVIVLSAVGVAALTGMIPSSKGQPKQLELPQEIVQPVAPAISHPVAKPASPKPAARKTTAIGQLAVVESVREVKAPGEAKGVGAVAGGVAGGVLGHKLGKGKGLVTVIGAAGGAIAGHQIEKQVRADKRWETTVRFGDGTQRTLTSEAQPAWRAGDRVRMVNGELRAA